MKDEINYEIVEDIQNFIINNNIPVLSNIYYIPKYTEHIGSRYYVRIPYLSRRLIDKVCSFEALINHKYDSKIMLMMKYEDYINDNKTPTIEIDINRLNNIVIKEIQNFLIKYNIGSQSDISFDNNNYHVDVFKTSNKQNKAIKKFKEQIQNIYHSDVMFNIFH